MLTVTLFSFANVLVNLSLPKFLQLSQALRVFSLHARGPAFEHYAAQFQDECNKVTYYLDRNLFLWRPPFWETLSASCVNKLQFAFVFSLSLIFLFQFCFSFLFCFALFLFLFVFFFLF